MEVVAATANGTRPFHDHDVREWSRIDSLTGVLERARLETDHWTSNTSNSKQKYGKVVDSRARTDADGSLQQQARRQLEVYHSQVPGGRLQVIKTHTVSSSRFSSNNSLKLSDFEAKPSIEPADFENLHLALNTLDLSSEKSKANLARSASRRPPSARNRSKIDTDTTRDATSASTTSSELTKSTSSEDVSQKAITEDLEDLTELQNWRRTSKLRRSLQYPSDSKTPPRPPDLPENVGTVRKIKEELEKGRRLSTALRGNNVDLEALDHILQTISSEGTKATVNTPKRNSFVTVENLKEVRGRLRRTEDIEDDGIVTEHHSEMTLKPYIHGADKTISGTGSLESRSKPNSHVGDDWHNRRKSYGFEQTPASNRLTEKSAKMVDSSTDSGICRSSEVVNFTTNVKQMSSLFDRKSTTITIPICRNFDIDKRHSIAVDETKYVTTKPTTILEESGPKKSSKKVEFCKTEVHFAADCGKVNIVETDEKPPPTNNFRRRRRNSGPIYAGELPALRFGDTNYEKLLLGIADAPEPETLQTSGNGVTVTLPEDTSMRGILKNKPIPYHLGEEELAKPTVTDAKWGVQLKPVHQGARPETFWKSTVTLHNTVYGEGEEELQKLLKRLKPTGPGETHQNKSHNDDQWTENKVYSTKVNFGDGGATTVVQDRQPNVPKGNGSADDSNNRIKFGTSALETSFSDSNATSSLANRKSALFARLSNLKTGENLSSPFLVGQSTAQTNSDHHQPVMKRQSDCHNDTRLTSERTNVKHDIDITRNVTSDSAKVSNYRQNINEPVSYHDNGQQNAYQNVTDIKLHKKHLNGDIVLRQPNKSEMTYFGVKASEPKVARKAAPSTVIHPETPDLILEHGTKDPIYENLPRTTKKQSQFDSTMLDELTRAADEIMQAVNGMTDDEKTTPNTKLDTINESKCYKSSKVGNNSRLARKTSSNSSLDSLVGRNQASKAVKSVDKIQRNTRAESGGACARASLTKARRLQRASSREALLQSHGSSSEDLGANAFVKTTLSPGKKPVRKTRQVRKTKTVQLSIQNGLNGTELAISKSGRDKGMGKLNKDGHREAAHRTARLCNKTDDNDVVRESPVVKEIRHKTAISTIRSVAEKSSRERSKTRSSNNSDSAEKRKTIHHSKRDTSKSTKSGTRNEPKRQTTPNNGATESSTSMTNPSNNRRVIATANIKKCQRTPADSVKPHC